MTKKADAIEYDELNAYSCVQTGSVLFDLFINSVGCNEDVVINCLCSSGKLLHCNLKIFKRDALRLHLIDGYNITLVFQNYFNIAKCSGLPVRRVMTL